MDIITKIPLTLNPFSINILKLNGKEEEDHDDEKLNLVINGKGIAWIDDIRVLKGPLQ
jgi:hypothetical protein